ncbi:hypothetical protein ACQRC6_08240 [Peptoniphilus sp. SGI.035]|uniref:hypothetical protein n=1 Tax=Peptoniphilus sp. SGI.035 TaxID=3420564 RepID=UPI003D007373
MEIKTKKDLVIKQEPCEEDIEKLIKNIIDLSDEEEKLIFIGFLNGFYFSLEMKKIYNNLLSEVIHKVIKS